MRLLMLVVLVAATACVGSTEPGRSPNCIFPGDTIGVIYRQDRNGVVTECAWLLSDAMACFKSPVGRIPLHCVVGERKQSH